MPQIDTPLLLDILLGLVILLFVPFGIRRGVAKEAMVSAGVLLGATLAERFGEAWGAELTTRFGLNQGTATFAASAALLLACTFLLGYGAGAALGRSRPGTASRLAGGLLAAFNAAFLLSTLFGWIDQYLQQGAALDDGIVGEALLRRADLLLLAAAGVLLVLTVVGWIVNASRSRRQPRESNGSLMGWYPAAAASGADGQRRRRRQVRAGAGTGFPFRPLRTGDRGNLAPPGGIDVRRGGAMAARRTGDAGDQWAQPLESGRGHPAARPGRSAGSERRDGVVAVERGGR